MNAHREEGRRIVAGLARELDRLRDQAREVAKHRVDGEREAELVARNGGLYVSMSGKRYGHSGETAVMRRRFAELHTEELERRRAELAYLQRKLARTVRFYGFNDIDPATGREWRDNG